MNNEKNVFRKFLEQFIIPETGLKPFENFKDVRNRRKVANTIVDTLKDLGVNVSDEELQKINEELENYEQIEEIRKDQKKLNELKENLESQEKGEKNEK